MSKKTEEWEIGYSKGRPAVEEEAKSVIKNSHAKARRYFPEVPC